MWLTFGEGLVTWVECTCIWTLNVCDRSFFLPSSTDSNNSTLTSLSHFLTFDIEYSVLCFLFVSSSSVHNFCSPSLSPFLLWTFFVFYACNLFFCLLFCFCFSSTFSSAFSLLLLGWCLFVCFFFVFCGLVEVQKTIFCSYPLYTGTLSSFSNWQWKLFVN